MVESPDPNRTKLGLPKPHEIAEPMDHAESRA